MQNILVTGGAGFVGTHLVTNLASHGYNVIIIDIQDVQVKLASNVIAYKNDIRDTATIQHIIKKEKIDTCIHLAAKVSVAESVINPMETIDVNLRGTVSVLDACTRSGVNNFVFSSSAAVYGNPRSLPVSEIDVLKPLSPYGISKVDGEKIVAEYMTHKMIKKTISLRFFNIYGKGQNPEYAGVIAKFAERLSRGLPPIIYGDGNQTRDFISVNDVVRAVMLAAESRDSGNFNVGTGKAISVNELAERMIEMFGLNLKPIYLEPKKGDIMHSCADMVKTRQYLHFDTNYDLISELVMMYSESLLKRHHAIAGQVPRLT